MKRSVRFAFVLIGLIAAQVQAGDKSSGFWSNVKRDFHRNNCWPEPFIYADRETTIAPFGVMIAKGWEKQNLLGDYHFEDGKSEITEAGLLKIRAILTQSPVSRRTIFVQQGLTQESTAARVDAIQQAVAAMVPAGQLPAVEVSEMDSTGWSAEYIDTVSRRFQASTPDPRLPKYEDEGTGN